MAPRVAIIGAGPAGCMLARLLTLRSVPVVVFEGEPSPNYRSQGGTLDLHTESGLAAMQDAGLFDEFLKHARYDGESMVLADKNLKVYFRESPSKQTAANKLGGQRPEIDRAELRRILTESLPEGVIRWGHRLKQVEDNGTLVFEHTSESGFDLIVGADGCWSKVRNALTGQHPIFARVACFELQILDPETTVPTLHGLVNRGSVFAHADGRMLSVQQMGDGSLHVMAIQARDSEKWQESCGFDTRSIKDVKAALIGEGGPFADWHPTLRTAIETANDAKCVPRSLFMLPVGFTWPHRRGFTVIGDAAHVMTPFAGEGVNLALDDARKLAKAIISAAPGDAHDLDDAVIASEKELWQRTVKVTKLTDDVTQAWFFTPGVPKSVIARIMCMHLKEHIPAILYPFAAAFVHCYYFIWSLWN
ncbi:unnamed protein product (mitochondrion) [Plasmodiophora brassicae]|uniref:FAD-binding domain-containing protein n=1 Tax=Plasmodiophora brassicae TaxID=37360 RepID=A0A0G4IX57_PLABS|nr:hypothetical protein PBRA_007349 [Plasmodiophora brassicae]SPQ98047.1 unnamed protein product [Plasmodiophora brassicae]